MPGQSSPVADTTERLARVANIERGMAIYEALVGLPHGLTVGELALQLRLPKSAVSRILATFQNDGYVARDPLSNRFRIALKLISLVLRHVDRLGIDELCLPLMRSLAEETGELVQLALVDGEEMRFVAKADGPHRIRAVSLMGTKVETHSMAAGKVWLASLPRSHALKLALADGLKRHTNTTITTIEDFGRELDQVRERGYAMNLGEFAEGVHSIAAPIRSQRMGGAVLGAAVLTGPEFRLAEARLAEHAPALEKLGGELGEILPADLVKLPDTA